MNFYQFKCAKRIVLSVTFVTALTIGCGSGDGGDLKKSTIAQRTYASAHRPKKHRDVDFGLNLTKTHTY